MQKFDWDLGEIDEILPKPRPARFVMSAEISVKILYVPWSFESQFEEYFFPHLSVFSYL